jgi:hypothetical protein
MRSKIIIRRPLLARGHQAVRHLLFHALSMYVFILSFYIQLSLLSHTFLLSHIATDPQSESPISQLTVRPPTPQSPKTVAKCTRPPWCLSFSGPQDPPIRVVKHTLYSLTTPIRVVKPTLDGPEYPIHVAFPTFVNPYLSNMAQEAPQIATTWHLYRPTRPRMIQNGIQTAQHGLIYSPDILRCPQDSQTWPEDSPRRVTMNFNTSAK